MSSLFLGVTFFLPLPAWELPALFPGVSPLVGVTALGEAFFADLDAGDAAALPAVLAAGVFRSVASPSKSVVSLTFLAAGLTYIKWTEYFVSALLLKL